MYRSPATTKPILHTAKEPNDRARIRHRIFVPDKPFIPYRTAGFTVAHTFHIIGTRSCYCMRKCVLLLNDKNNNNAKKKSKIKKNKYII